MWTEDYVHLLVRKTFKHALLTQAQSAGCFLFSLPVRCDPSPLPANGWWKECEMFSFGCLRETTQTFSESGLLNPGTHWKISLQVSFSIVMLAVFYVNSRPLFCHSVDFVWRMEEIQRLGGAFKANVFRDPNGTTECSIKFERFPSGILCSTACSLEEPLSLCIVVYVCTSSFPWRGLLLLFSPPVFGVAHLQYILNVNLFIFDALKFWFIVGWGLFHWMS